MTKSVYRWLVFLCVLAACVALGYLASRHAVAEHWAASTNPDMWLRAATLEPANADNWYRLGRYRELDFDHGDIVLAISYYRRATSLEPINALYWMDLADAYETSGDPRLAENAYRQALQDYPISGEAAWRYGNFLLRQDRLNEAFQQIQHAVLIDPSLATLAVSRCWRSTQDVDQIVDFALPNDAEAYWGAMQFFIEAKEPDAAMAVWRKLAPKLNAQSLARASALMDLLIQSGKIENAVTVWKQAIGAAGAPSASGSPLMWDGGFERNLMNVGFAWRYQPIEGADLGWDEETHHSGQRSLRISFDGSEKLNFSQIWQYVAVSPNTKYQFRAYVRTEGLNTDSGIQFEIQDATQQAAPPVISSTASLVGEQPWTLLEAVVSTGPQTHLLKMVLRRYPSDILTGKLEGTVWVDDVALEPVSGLN